MPESVRIPQVGDPLPSFEVDVTQDRVQRYADASGDHNPIHVDTVFAASTSLGGTIAHGMLLLAYVSRLLTQRFGSAWLEGGVLDARFRSPAFVGSRIAVGGEVSTVELIDNVARVVCALRVEDAAGQALVTTTARLTLSLA
jgi:3-hydroxybutyryl-CoA dehydratase